MEESPSQNVGLDLLRVTESAAIAAGRFIGLGDKDSTHIAATQAMSNQLKMIDIDGHIVVGEEVRLGEHSSLDSGVKVGTTRGPKTDVVVDPIDVPVPIPIKPLIVTIIISLVGIAPEGTMWSPPPEAIYMDKIVVDREAAEALVPECLDAPAAWTLALVARVKNKSVRDLTVIVLDRQRHRDLIGEIRAAGARISLRTEGDAEGALEAALYGSGADVLMGAGGVSEGVTAACAVRALGGGMLVRLAPQDETEKHAIQDAGIDPDQILTSKQLVTSSDIFFAATGITGGPLLRPIQFEGEFVRTYSILLRAATGTVRFIEAEHALVE